MTARLLSVSAADVAEILALEAAELAAARHEHMLDEAARRRGQHPEHARRLRECMAREQPHDADEPRDDE